MLHAGMAPSAFSVLASDRKRARLLAGYRLACILCNTINYGKGAARLGTMNVSSVAPVKKAVVKPSAAEMAIGACIGVIAFVAIAYFAWYRSLAPLWHWTTAAWWHWGPAFFAFFILFVLPIFVIGETVTVVRRGADSRREYWWGRAALAALVVLFLLILSAFAPRPAWWASWHWVLWSAAVIAVSILSAGARMFVVVQTVDALRPRDNFEHEWRFNKSDHNAPPMLGLAMSGGGIRSAAFNLGVLKALHDKGILSTVDVMSAVSGGSYAMSWYLLQPLYAKRVANADGTFDFDAVVDEMFDSECRFQTYLRRRPTVVSSVSMLIAAVLGAILEQPSRALGSIGDFVSDLYNRGGILRHSYRRGIQKLFHGHPDPHSKEKIQNDIGFTRSITEVVRDGGVYADFSHVDPVTYRELAQFAEEYGLPFFVFNGALLVERAHRAELQATAFELTADDLGSDLCGYRRWDDYAKDVASERTSRKRGIWLDLVNIAPAISGAAVGLARFDAQVESRAMKRKTWLPYIANVDLGFLFPRKVWRRHGMLYVSDGGHADNLGAYALIKRRCRTIVVVDAEHEKEIPYVFQAYTRLKKGLEDEHLSLSVDMIDAYLKASNGTKNRRSFFRTLVTRLTRNDLHRQNHPYPFTAVMTGSVQPLSSGDDPVPEGVRPIAVVYIKLGLDPKTLDRYPEKVRDFAGVHDVFPHDPTTTQSYSSRQFDAYRELGRYVGEQAVSTIKEGNKKGRTFSGRGFDMV